MMGICSHLGCVPLSDKGSIMVGFVRATDLITIHPGELEKVQLRQIWKFQSMLLLMKIRLKLDKFNERTHVYTSIKIWKVV